MNISLDTVTEFLYSNLINVSKKDSNSFIARCPICGDSKKSLSKRRFNLIYKTPETILWNCFNCNRGGNFIQLYAFINNISEKEAYKKLRGNSLETLKFKKTTPEIIEKTTPTFENFDWILNDCITTEPEGIIQNKLYAKFLEFKKSRKINYPMFVTYKGDFRARVILPIYQNDQMIYFQARALLKSDKKYKNPKAPKQHIIFNKDKWDPTKPVIITEGMLDALSVGNQATMCLGASINKEFINQIPNPIITLDNDETGKKETLKLTELFPKLIFCVYNKNETHIKDLNELLINGIDPYNYILNNSYSAFKTKLLLKL